LSNSPSLVHCFVGGVYDIQVIINSCPKLKCIIYSGGSAGFSRLLSIKNQTLQQFYIKPHFLNVTIPTSFLQSVSAHGKLVHVVLCTGTLLADGIIALVENSPAPELLTCHIYASRIVSPDNNYDIALKDMKVELKRIFSKRKLFSCGNFNLSKVYLNASFYSLDNVLAKLNTDIFSLWSTMYLYSAFGKVIYF